VMGISIKQSCSILILHSEIRDKVVYAGPCVLFIGISLCLLVLKHMFARPRWQKGTKILPKFWENLKFTITISSLLLRITQLELFEIIQNFTNNCGGN
jgi:hypothetical protein